MPAGRHLTHALWLCLLCAAYSLAVATVPHVDECNACDSCTADSYEVQGLPAPGSAVTSSARRLQQLWPERDPASTTAQQHVERTTTRRRRSRVQYAATQTNTTFAAGSTARQATDSGDGGIGFKLAGRRRGWSRPVTPRARQATGSSAAAWPAEMTRITTARDLGPDGSVAQLIQVRSWYCQCTPRTAWRLQVRSARLVRNRAQASQRATGLEQCIMNAKEQKTDASHHVGDPMLCLCAG